ncbi:hypothetical protein [Streptosporangium roseum]|uniref:hypothetical protein n=1 Tax=Streptosporangium roseum TaxID=2001 RepID=UPI0004CCE432|nr:hypothetical protein [Streptosporangium roseum]
MPIRRTRLAHTIAPLAAALTLAGALAAPASASANRSALTGFVIESANGCTQASFDYAYTYISTFNGRKAYKVYLNGQLSDYLGDCYDDNYGGALQFKGYRYSGSMWTNYSATVFVTYDADDHTTMITTDKLPTGLYSDLHFRACNKGPTGNVGTCGAWTGS